MSIKKSSGHIPRRMSTNEVVENYVPREYAALGGSTRSTDPEVGDADLAPHPDPRASLAPSGPLSVDAMSSISQPSSQQLISNTIRSVLRVLEQDSELSESDRMMLEMAQSVLAAMDGKITDRLKSGNKEASRTTSKKRATRKKSTS